MNQVRVFRLQIALCMRLAVILILSDVHSRGFWFENLLVLLWNLHDMNGF